MHFIYMLYITYSHKYTVFNKKSDEFVKKTQRFMCVYYVAHLVFTKRMYTRADITLFYAR